MIGCPCDCHGGAYTPCSVPGGCGHLHRNDKPLSSADAARALGGDMSVRHRKSDPAAQPVAVITPTPKASERPDGTCLTHRAPSEGRPWRRPDDGYRTCGDCCTRMHRWLSPVAVDDDGRAAGIPGLYATLNPQPGSSGDNGGIRPPGFGSRSPANDHIVSMRDHRTVAINPKDPRSAPAILREWVLWVWLERYDDAALDRSDYQKRRRELPVSVDSAAAWLDNQLDYLTRHEIVTDFFDELRGLHSQLRSIGDRRRPVGECPNTIDDGDSTRQCGATLFAPLNGDSIRCHACNREWLWDSWWRLGNLLNAG